MNVMSLFRGAATPTPQAQQQQVPQFGQLPNNEPTMSQGGQQGQLNPALLTQQQPAPDVPSKSPSELLAEFWKIDTTPKENAFVPFEAPRFNLDAAKLNTAVSSMDFTKGITPEQLQKINAGGQDAMQTMLSVVNTMVQQAVAQTTMANSKVMESALASTTKNIADSVPSVVNSHNLNAAVSKVSPLFSNPATKPMLDSLKRQLVAAYPNASPDEIAVEAQKQLQNFVSEITSTLPQQQSQQQSGKVDWDKLAFG
jgi:hypothetical protein